MVGLAKYYRQITLRAEQRGMTQQRLNGSQIHPGYQKVSSKTVPQRMNLVPFFNASHAHGRSIDVSDDTLFGGGCRDGLLSLLQASEIRYFMYRFRYLKCRFVTV